RLNHAKVLLHLRCGQGVALPTPHSVASYTLEDKRVPVEQKFVSMNDQVAEAGVGGELVATAQRFELDHKLIELRIVGGPQANVVEGPMKGERRGARIDIASLFDVRYGLCTCVEIRRYANLACMRST